MAEFCRKELQHNIHRFRRIAHYGDISQRYFAEEDLISILIGCESGPNVNLDDSFIRQGNQVLRMLQSFNK